MKLKMLINATAGYSADQVKAITIGDLKQMLEWYEDEDTIVLYDHDNRYGAPYGVINDLEEIDEDDPWEDEEDEEDEPETGAVIIDGTTVLTATHTDIS